MRVVRFVSSNCNSAAIKRIKVKALIQFVLISLLLYRAIGEETTKEPEQKQEEVIIPKMALWAWHDPFDLYSRPSRILNQRFGLDLEPEDLLSPLERREIRNLLCPAGYFRPWSSLSSKQDAGSTVKYDSNQFQASLDVQQFKPEEITVKVSGDNTVTIEGKHEEKADEHGFISRHFVRKYVLPEKHDVDQIESKLSSDGVLTITVPRVDKGTDEKVIPITQTGQPSKTTQAKPVEEKKDNK